MTQPETLEYQPKRVKKDRSKAHFWRATSYLRPYRKLVIISIIAAFIAGGVFAGGLTAVLPILQTLLHGDTPQMWVDRMVAEERWGIDLADDPTQLRLIDAEDRITNAPPPEELDEEGRWPLPGMDAATLATGEEEAVEQWFIRQHVGPIERPIPFHLRLLRRAIYLLPANPVGAVAAIMGLILFLTVFSNIIRFFQQYLSGKAALSAVNDIRRNLYDHILRVPMAYFGKSGASDVTSRIVHDSSQLQQGFTTLLGPAVQQPIMGGAAFLVALWLDWRLTLFIIAFAPVMAVVLAKFGKKMRRASRRALENNSELLGQIEATLSGIRVVKANNAETHESGRLRRVLDALLRYQIKLQKYDAASSPVMETLGVVAVAVIVVVMTYFVREQNTLTAGEGILIFGCLAQMADSLRRVSKLNLVLQKANAAAERIFETVDLPSESDQRSQSRKDAKRDAKREAGVVARGSEAISTSSLRSDFASLRLCDLRPLEREIAFENVSFSYSPDMPPALVDVSLAVAKGESIAVVGRNGSGKTTLLSLLPRFYDPDAGRITVDGVDIREVTLESLRRQIGVVTQEAVVFPGTIAENIAYAQLGASREQIEAAARQAEAHQFILEKPLGYDTPLSGLGGSLSGGQRQRLNIARAILRDPPILILDEATSQVDAESEHLIQQAIGRLMQGRTVFVIAHRFSTILDCDRIALMEAGRLQALGTHDDLLETSELYRTLYDRQLVGV